MMKYVVIALIQVMQIYSKWHVENNLAIGLHTKHVYINQITVHLLIVKITLKLMGVYIHLAHAIKMVQTQIAAVVWTGGNKAYQFLPLQHSAKITILHGLRVFSQTSNGWKKVVQLLTHIRMMMWVAHSNATTTT